MPLDARIESLLFWKGEPMAIKKISALLEISEDQIHEAIKILETKLEGRGLQLVRKDDEIMLGTHPEMSATIEKLVKDELIKDLGKAGLETLSIILYRGPVGRKDIDYIRGVQSNFIVRNLLVRGLIEKVPAPNEQRSVVYKPTFQLLSYLGITKLEDLPEYIDVQKELTKHHTEVEQPSDLDGVETEAEISSEVPAASHES